MIEPVDRAVGPAAELVATWGEPDAGQHGVVIGFALAKVIAAEMGLSIVDPAHLVMQPRLRNLARIHPSPVVMSTPPRHRRPM